MNEDLMADFFSDLVLVLRDIREQMYEQNSKIIDVLQDISSHLDSIDTRLFDGLPIPDDL